MLRTGELITFLAPFLAFLVWRRLSVGRGPTGATLVATFVGLALFGAALAWFGVHEALAPGGRYVPAHVVDGRIVPGQSAP